VPTTTPLRSQFLSGLVVRYRERLRELCVTATATLGSKEEQNHGGMAVVSRH
jgi:hypothetical protein